MKYKTNNDDETKRTIKIQDREINTIIADLQRIQNYYPLYETEFIRGVIWFLNKDGCISPRQQAKLQHIYRERFVQENQDLIDALNKPKDKTSELITKILDESSKIKHNWLNITKSDK